MQIAAPALGLGVAFPLAVATAIVCAHRGRTHVAIDRGELRCRHHVLGWSLHQTRVAVAAIEQVRVQSGGPRTPHLHPGVAVVAHDRVLVLGGALDAPARDWLRAWLLAQLGGGVHVAAT